MSRQWTKADFDKKNAENAAEETAVMERLPSKFHMNCTIYTRDQAQAALRKHFHEGIHSVLVIEPFWLTPGNMPCERDTQDYIDKRALQRVRCPTPFSEVCAQRSPPLACIQSHSYHSQIICRSTVPRPLPGGFSLDQIPPPLQGRVTVCGSGAFYSTAAQAVNALQSSFNRYKPRQSQDGAEVDWKFVAGETNCNLQLEVAT